MILSNGVYLQDELITPAEDETILAAVIRSRRNRLLEESDKYMLPDFPISAEERKLWEQYRALLRSLPDQEGFPFNAVFPEVAENE